MIGMKKVFVAGGVTYDQIIYMDTLPQGKAGSIFSSRSLKCVGGTGAGKALNLDKLGFDTSLHAFVGGDEEGEKIKKYMAKTGIEFISEHDDAGTQRFTNLIDKDGRRISIFTTYNTFEPDYNMTKVKEKIMDSDYVVLNIMNYCRYLIPAAKEAGKEIWCDIHDYDGKNDYYNDFIEGADYIFMSSEYGVDHKALMKKFIGMGKKLVVCTHGKDGAEVMNSNYKVIEVPIIDKYEMKDVNGAGDSFFAGFLYGFSKGESIEKCMKYATINGGLSITSDELYYKELSTEVLEREYDEYYGK